MKILKICLSFLLVLFIAVTCQWFVTVINLKFPGALLGMIILTILMYYKIVDLKFVELSGNILLKHISLFFIPLLVGGIDYLFVIKNEFITIFVVFMITSILLVIFVGLTFQYLLFRKIYRNKVVKLK